jgi:glycosyltransferase involved in cell wall biosynthesis
VLIFQAAVDASSAKSSLLRSLMAEASRLVAVSQAAANNVMDTLKVAPDRITIIPPGIPEQEFIPTSNEARVEEPTFAFLGRLVRDKGADIALAAAVKARTHHDIKLRIIGDGPERNSLQQQIRAEGAGDFIELTGHVDDEQRRALLSTSFTLLVPSRHLELFGMVAVEGALAALPVIAARRGGLPEIVRDRETGLTVPADDPPALADAMRALVRDPAWAARMGTAGRARALAEYSLEATVDRYESLLAATVAAEPVRQIRSAAS